MEYIFEISGYDAKKLLPQVSRGLETRTQLLSRQKYPGMWKATDALRAVPKGDGTGSSGRKFFSVICLALGIFLFVPGVMKPQELQGPLFMGAIAIGAGIGGLLRGKRTKKNPFEKAARQLLAGKESAENSTRIIFSSEGMHLSEGGEVIPYGDFEFFIECADVYLITFTGRVVLLQKKDLRQEEAAFAAFIAEHTVLTKSI